MGRNVNQQVRPAAPQTLDSVLIAVKAAREKKASDLVVLDLRPVASFTDYFVICTGTNARQVQAVADSVEEHLRNAGKRPLHVEGRSGAEWILLDYGDFIVHALNPAARRFYDLERLWRDADRLELPPEQA